MIELMYTRYADWWPLLSPPGEYADEAAIYARLLAEDDGEGGTLLELGSGGGNVASHLVDRFDVTLCDLAPDMLRVSRKLLPGVEHIQGDMRTLKLGRTFDRVLIHDAIMYMTTKADLKAALETAYAHLRPGGRALFVPDQLAETFEPRTSHGGADGDDGRAMRYMEWCHPVEPDAHVVRVVYAYVMSHPDGTITSDHDVHYNGLFPRATWMALLGEVGFAAEARVVPVVDEELGIESLEVFVGQRPGG